MDGPRIKRTRNSSPCSNAWDLADGGKAVALFNLSDKDQVIDVSKPQIGLSGIMRYCWRQKDADPFCENFSLMVSPHGIALVKIMP